MTNPTTKPAMNATSHAALRAPRRSRRGTIYALVLGSGLVLTLMGVTGLALVNARRARVERAASAGEARAAAQAGLEVATHFMTQDPAGTGWRTAVGPYKLLDRWALGKGTVTVTLTDPLDADLRAKPADRVRLASSAAVGDASQTIALDIVPRLAPLSVLNASAWAGSDVSFASTFVFGRTGLGSNTAVRASGSTVACPVAAPAITGSTYSAGTTIVAARTMPGADAAAAWIARATPIARTAFANSGRFLGVALGPNYNPAGPANPDGIYIIDCGGQRVTFQSCRINGTLIIVNPNAVSSFTGEVAFEARPGQPSLIVVGDFHLDLTSQDLSEAAAPVNFNPVGFPSERGVADADTTDFYASQIAGLTYVTGNLRLTGANTFGGVLLVGGSLTVEGVLTLRHRDLGYIEGFGSVTGFSLDESSVTRVVE